MRSLREATERTIQPAEQHISRQEARIERQKTLISSLGHDGHAELAQAARQLLNEMTDMLARMHDELRDARERFTARDE
jgi:hypothetical protein